MSIVHGLNHQKIYVATLVVNIWFKPFKPWFIVNQVLFDIQTMLCTIVTPNNSTPSQVALFMGIKFSIDKHHKFWLLIIINDA